MVRMTNSEYQSYVKARCPASPLWKDMLRAFGTGGLICVLGQALRELWALRLEGEAAGTAASITLVLLGTLATGLGIYDRIAKWGGAGTLVPITGFANSMASPALEFKSEGWITGLAAKMFQVAGPVLVYGLSAGVLYGLIYLLLQRM